MKKPPILILTVLALILLSACASRPGFTPMPEPAQPVVHEPTGKGTYWWYARFQIVWPENEPPNWTVDLMLADRIVKPAIEVYRSEIHLWRFHRRAARDNAGHQFSFIFYSDPQTAAHMYRQIEVSGFLEQLISAGLVNRVLFDNTKTPQRPAVEDTSDPNWPVELRKAWPLFIMGVSENWLDLVEQYIPPSVVGHTDALDLFPIYRSADEKISQIWRHNAQHAYLHHLNALFGYQTMMLKKPIRF